MNNLQETKQSKLIKNGDIIKLGNHILVCGDSRNQDLVNKAFKDIKIDLVCTDPPYGVDYVQGKKELVSGSNQKHIQNDDISNNQDYYDFSKEWIQPVLPFLTRKNAFYIFNSDKMLFLLRSAMTDLGIKISQLLIWVKDSPVMGRLDYLPQHELILYGWNGVHDFRRSKSKSVLFYPRPKKSTLHPTTKPLPLIRHLILNNTKAKEVVYDPFLGSGTTLIACEQAKRVCIGFEIDPEYCQIIIDRYSTIIR
jgi:DNA modification methylase